MPRPVARLALSLALLVATLLAAAPSPAAAAPPCAVTTTADAGTGSLRAALADDACAAIRFALPGDGPWSIALASTLPAIARDLTLLGPGRDLLVLDGQGVVRPILITGGRVTLTGMTIANGRSDSPGGVYPDPGDEAGLAVRGGAVTLRHLRVRDSTQVGGLGGGMYIGGGVIALDDVDVRRNVAAAFAGILAGPDYGPLTLTIANSTIAENVAQRGSGGGIGMGGVGMTAELLGVIVEGNVADAYGGGIFVGDDARATVVGGAVRGNRTAGFGGGAAAYGILTLRNTTVNKNTATSGGGLFVGGLGSTTVQESSVADNAARDQGGGFLIYGRTLSLVGSTVSGNSAASTGGGIQAQSHDVTAITNSTISGNTAGELGGGIWGTRTALDLATVTGNVAPAAGGLALDGTSSLVRSIVVGNGQVATPDDCRGPDTDGATLVSHGYNVVADGSGCPADGPGDLAFAGPVATILDRALLSNGGPPRTHALVPGSPAIDRVPLGQCPLVADQRGVARPQGIACDSGAVEGTGLALTVDTTLGGQIEIAPPGRSLAEAVIPIDRGALITLTPHPNRGFAFTGWRVDGEFRGWAQPLTLTMGTGHRLEATFALITALPDAGGDPAENAAIVALANRGLIRGYADGRFGPVDRVQRAQLAALVARAMPSFVPSWRALTPPSCLVAGTWDCEDWGTPFTDRGGLDRHLWRDVGVLAHHGVAVGYGDGAYGPTDSVTYAQTIALVTRAMLAQGYWHPHAYPPYWPSPYAGVPQAHADDVKTFHRYTAARGGVPAPPADWNAPATRGWFALTLWAALDSYWGADGLLPDGRPAGGMVP